MEKLEKASQVFFKKVKKAVSDFDLIQPGKAVLAAVSGGPDSTALLRAIVELKEELGIREVGVFHLNHKLREEAYKDEQFVKELVKKFKLKGFFYRYQVNEFAEQKGISVEEAGRFIRYKFLKEISERFGYELVAVGHTLDDFAETVVMRFITNSNFEALKGIQPKSGKIIRPLIYLRKKEILDYLNEISQPFCEDITNLTGENVRSLIRTRLMPEFEEINPSFVFQVFKLAMSVNEVANFLDENASELEKKLVKAGENFFEVDVSELKKIHPAVRKRFFYKLIVDAGILPKHISRAHVEALDKALFLDSGAQIELPQGFSAVREFDKLLVGKKSDFFEAKIKERTFNVPGSVFLDELGIVLKAEVLKEKPESLGDGKNSCVLDCKKTGKILKVRSWQKGDRIIPFGMTGEKKLQDIFVDRKVPRRNRMLVPVVEAENGKICWIAGQSISAEFSVDETTEEFLRLSLETGEKMEEE